MTQLRSVTCHMGSHSVTCYPTQVNTPRLNPSHAGWYSIYLPRRDGRLSWPSWLDSAPAGSRTSDLSITSPTPNRCTTKTWLLCRCFKWPWCLFFIVFFTFNFLVWSCTWCTRSVCGTWQDFGKHSCRQLPASLLHASRTAQSGRHLLLQCLHFVLFLLADENAFHCIYYYCFIISKSNHYCKLFI